MARPKKDPSTVLDARVEVRISSAEKAALDRLCAEHGSRLAAQGIANGDTAAVWIRAVIREKAAAAGYPVEDARAPEPPAPSPKPRKR
jgi:hypothetical protein